MNFFPIWINDIQIFETECLTTKRSIIKPNGRLRQESATRERNIFGIGIEGGTYKKTSVGQWQSSPGSDGIRLKPDLYISKTPGTQEKQKTKKT